MSTFKLDEPFLLKYGRDEETCRLLEVSFHRNGSGPANGFFILTFDDGDGDEMVAIIFPHEDAEYTIGNDIAILCRSDLGKGNARNGFRGDYYKELCVYAVQRWRILSDNMAENVLPWNAPITTSREPIAAARKIAEKL